MSNILGVIIGRFQCVDLHEGHHRLIHEVCERHKDVLVLIGDRNAPNTSTNPLSYAIRARMIREHYDNVHTDRVWDCRTNEQWSQQVDEIIGSLYMRLQLAGAKLYSGRDSFIPHYRGAYPTEELQLGMDETCATAERRLIGQFPLHSKEFRRGIIYAYENLWPRTYTTVDIAVIKEIPNHPTQLLLVKRNVEAGWRLPGGYREKNELLVDAARRELREETGLWLENSPQYVEEFLIDDWRLRGSVNECQTTTLFLGYYFSGGITASDDVDDARWFELQQIADNLTTMIVPEHQALVQKALKEHDNNLYRRNFNGRQQ